MICYHFIYNRYLRSAPPTLGAAETAYMRDVSEPHELYVVLCNGVTTNIHHLASSRNFSFLVSIFPIGGIVGPVTGSFIAQRTGTVISVLYATTIMHLIYASIVLFLMPESVSETSMMHARNQYASKLASAVDIDAGPFRRRLLVFAKAFWDSFPLHVLTPKRLSNSRWKRDYDLTLLALSAGLINVIFVRMVRYCAMHTWLTQTYRHLGERCFSIACIPSSGRPWRYVAIGHFHSIVNFVAAWLPH